MIKKKITDYEELTQLCASGEPVFLTGTDGEDNLIVMEKESFYRRQKMLELREELLKVEEDRLHGRRGVTIDDLETELDSIIQKADGGYDRKTV